jgi:hypothetical protein
LPEEWLFGLIEIKIGGNEEISAGAKTLKELITRLIQIK